MKLKKKESGQVTLEYVIMAGAVVAFFVVFVARGGSYFQTRLEQGHTDTADNIKIMTDRLDESYRGSQDN